MPQEQLAFDKNYVLSIHLDYFRYLPPGYDTEPGKKWPMILFLHGAGERGTDPDLVKRFGIARIVEERDLPFITISPQCPERRTWSDYLSALDDLISLSIDTLNVDPQRIYLTGLSMGGHGTWHLAAEYPNRFAAIAPVCGQAPRLAGFPDRAAEIAHIPCWVFHGAKDDIIPISASQVMVEKLRQCGAEVHFTIYPDAGHDAWTETYNNPALYEWFLEHRRAG